MYYISSIGEMNHEAGSATKKTKTEVNEVKTTAHLLCPPVILLHLDCL